ncbi:hypothetical protein M9H77_08627 [Catharanthus roseus]|uniref:Uncharacterized protein n=1 Tax=Catharanthus roseus TaxID=4058 RepID=A0ACC0BY87_CATRO|nr:hypothetical protein M9H77_08627 [Catharanthus roseus]
MASGHLVLRANPSPISGSGDSNRRDSPVSGRWGTGQVKGRAVTALSRGVRRRHNTSDIPSTSAPIGPDMYYDLGAPGSSTRPPLYLLGPPPQTSYDSYAHATSLPIRMPGLDPTQYFSKTQIPLDEVSGPGLQLGAQFFEQLSASVLVDSSYSGAHYGVTDCGNPSSNTGLDRDSSTSWSEEAEKSRPTTNPTQRKKATNDGWEQTGPADRGPQDPILVPSYSGHIAV